MELFLNLLWLAVAITAFLTAPDRSKRTLFALGCALALLFPIISVSDDLMAGGDNFEEALAVVVEAVIFAITFVTIARVVAARSRRAAFVPAVSADPRSPPLG